MATKSSSISQWICREEQKRQLTPRLQCWSLSNCISRKLSCSFTDSWKTSEPLYKIPKRNIKTKYTWAFVNISMIYLIQNVIMDLLSLSPRWQRAFGCAASLGVCTNLAWRGSRVLVVWGAQRHAAGGSNGWITGPHRGAGLFWYAPHRAGTLLQERRYESFISGSTTSLIFTCVTERKTKGFFLL